jgi:hypothetical protein
VTARERSSRWTSDGDLLVLPADLLMVAVEELESETRGRLDAEPGDVALCRPGHRASTRVLDASAARFVSEFRAPTTIGQAAARYALATGRNAGEVLREAQPLVAALVAARFLLPAGEPGGGGSTPSLARVTVLSEWEVLAPVTCWEDMEVYQVRSSRGVLGALKIVRPGSPGRTAEAASALAREAAVLRRLDGAVNPALYEQGEHGGRPCLLVAWCAGMPVTSHATELRARGRRGAQALCDLAAAVLEAYGHLHVQGVIHGDVHARNILSTSDSAVRVLDFGLARLEAPTGTSGGLEEPRRGGIGYYFEPEYASAYLRRDPLPLASREGEQYALAALLYQLFTGEHYLDFRLDRETSLRQIAELMPLPFAERGTEPWPAVERVLAIALDKQPARRFASLTEFAARLRGVASPPPGRRKRPSGLERAGYRPPPAPPVIQGQKRLAATLERLRGCGDEEAVAAGWSVAHGKAGIAYFLYRVASLESDPELLSWADLWCRRGQLESSREGSAPAVVRGVAPRLATPASLHHGASGVEVVRALIALAMGDLRTLRKAVEGFVAVSFQPPPAMDLMGGRAGTLLACSLLVEAISGAGLAVDPELLHLGSAALGEIIAGVGKEGAGSPAPLPVRGGIAHDQPGLLYAGLRWCHAGREPVPATILLRLDDLAGPEPGRPARGHRPPRAGGEIRGAGWCQGSAGHVHLWTLAHETHGDSRFLELALRCGRDCWQGGTGARAGAHRSRQLCCGLAGQSYALLHLYRYLGDPSWLDRARELAGRALTAAPTASARRSAPADTDANSAEYAGGEQPLPPYSLYQGELGIDLLIADLAQPRWSAMPLFGTER